MFSFLRMCQALSFSSAKGDCSSVGGKEIRMRFVELINEYQLKGKVRANKSGCLDVCEMGPAIVIYPLGVWYTNFELSDVDEIFGDGFSQKATSVIIELQDQELLDLFSAKEFVSSDNSNYSQIEDVARGIGIIK